MVQAMAQTLLQSRMQNNPKFREIKQQFDQLMSGKTIEQQHETLLNYAVSRGYDRNNIASLLNSNFRL